MTKNSNAAQIRERLDKLTYHHPDFKRCLTHMESCHRSFGGDGEPECGLVMGDTGAGKTTLIRWYNADHPSYRVDEGKIVPVLTATIPIPATMKNMATELLLQLGDPYADKGTLETRTRRLRKLLHECRTELIVLDEFQHFIDRRTERVILDVSDWLKNLITNTRIPVVLVGLQQSARVLQANEQLQRRFSGEMELQTFNTRSQGRAKALHKLINIVDKDAAEVLGAKSNLIKHAEKILYATNGRISEIMKLLSHAAQEAARRGSNSITLTHLETAYRLKILRVRPSENPFSDKWIDPATKPGASDVTNKKPIKRHAKTIASLQ